MSAPYYFSLPYYYYLFQGEAEASYFRYRPSLLYTHRDVRCLTMHAMRCPSKRSSCVVRYEDGNVRAVCTRRRCKCIRLRNPFSLLLLFSLLTLPCCVLCHVLPTLDNGIAACSLHNCTRRVHLLAMCVAVRVSDPHVSLTEDVSGEMLFFLYKYLFHRPSPSSTICILQLHAS